MSHFTVLSCLKAYQHRCKLHFKLWYYLPGLHFLCSPAEGHVRVAGAGAIPLLLFDAWDEGATLACFPFAAPVVKHLLDQLIVLLQQQFGFLETDRLQKEHG